MKKHILIVVLLLLLIGCSDTTTSNRTQATTIATTTQTTTAVTTNLELEVPVISLVENLVIWSAILGVDEYQIKFVDVTPNAGVLIEFNHFATTTNEWFDIYSFSLNKLYEIQVRSSKDGEYSLYSNTVVANLFQPTGTVYESTYNILSEHDFVYMEADLPYIYDIQYNQQSILKEYYQQIDNTLFISKDYLQTFTDNYNVNLYTNIGIIELDIPYESITKPYMRSNNTITFNGEDIVLLYEFCGGEFVELNGSDISSSDYELVDNILTINAGFVQDLFDDNAERNSVILSYQLRNDDEIVIGYIFINK